MPDRLSEASSPYLLQHSTNPVDWYPWGEEAFEEAQRRQRPVFLSIGYSSCHWCHVMAHECFEDAEVAAMMNHAFISVKVDREEHPVVDRFYMSICTASGNRGGWPLTVLLTPERRPFYITTYLPKFGSPGRMGMMELIPRVQTIWEEHRSEVDRYADELTGLVESNTVVPDHPVEENQLCRRAFEAFRSRYDHEWGGFDQAPKFPTVHDLLFLMRFGSLMSNPEALDMVETTLSAINRGGIHDRVGSGFHRYATDRQWKLPHFEKMLSDQALLLIAYSEAFQLTGNKEFEDAARGIVRYVLRDLSNPSGLFYSAEDADSEGVEGKYYQWDWEELKQILSSEDLEYAARIWKLHPDGNVDDEATGRPTGKNLLYGELSPGGPDEYVRSLHILNRLLEARSVRIRPDRDEKILADWNGLMIAALAISGLVFNEASWIRSASKAADSLLAGMIGDEGILVHSSFSGHASSSGFLDDYSFVIWGLLELFSATGRAEYLQRGIDLANTQVRLFWDQDHGGFYLSDGKSEGLPARQKSFHDGAIPSGGSVAMMNLRRLATILDERELANIAKRQQQISLAEAEHHPMGHSSALAFSSGIMCPQIEIVVVEGEGALEIYELIRGYFIPQAFVVRLSSRNRAQITDLMPYLKEYEAIEGDTTVYVCQDRVCGPPISDPDELRDLFDSMKANPS